MIYLISSPYRVGSHYLQTIIDSTDHQVIKTHNPHLKVDYEHTCLILLNRRNRFNAVMSALVSGHTGVWFGRLPGVRQPKIDQYTAPYGGFKTQYKINKYYHQHHALSKPWNKIEQFYFEDFLNFPNHVFDRLKIQQKRSIEFPIKSFYRYHDIIVNVDECRKWYQELEDESLSVLTKEELDGLLIQSD